MCDDSFSHIINQLKDLNIKFNNYLIELQTQLDILNENIIICRQQMIDNEQELKELKRHVNFCMSQYNLYK
jgi:hypothetical protein